MNVDFYFIVDVKREDRDVDEIQMCQRDSWKTENRVKKVNTSFKIW